MAIMRRTWTIAAVCVASLALSACVSADRPDEDPGESGAKADGSIVVGTWGGDFGAIQEKAVVPVVAKNAPELSVVFDLQDAETRMTKMRAEESGTSSMDVVGLTGDRTAVLEDFLMELDMSKIPNAKYIKEPLRNDYCVPMITSVVGITYNVDKVKPAPTSYDVFWDEKNKGKIGFFYTDNWAPILYASAALAEGGDPADDWDAGWPLVESLQSEMDPQVFTSNEQLGQALQTGQIWMTITQQSRGVQWGAAGGEKLATVVPEETGFRYVSCVAIPKNAQNVDGAYEYLNAVLDPSAQKQFSENMKYAPTVTNADLDPELQDAVDTVEAEAAGRVTTEDYAYLAENYADWSQRFTQLLQR